MSPKEGLIILTDTNVLLKNGLTVDEVYEKHKNEDGFLYLVYAEENIYG